MQKKILLIDDDLEDRALFSEAMEEIAPDAICATSSNARKAILALEKGEIQPPDLIFMDINMPGMDGWQCLDFLKNCEVYKSIPVIMYSTSSHQEDIDKAQQAGALCFFNKPSSYKELKQCLKLLMQHLSDNTLDSLASSSSRFAVTNW